MSKKRKKIADASPQEAAPESVQDKCKAIHSAIHEQEEAQAEPSQNGETTDKPKRKKKKVSESKSPKDGKSQKSRKSGKSGKSKKKRKKNSLFPQQGDSLFEVLRKSIFLMSTAVFIVCMALIGQYFWENYQNSILKEKTGDIYGDPDNQPVIEEVLPDDDQKEERFPLLPGASSLLKINPDVVGFIEIRNINDPTEKPAIRYPVLQYKPEDHNDPDTNGNDYYLTRNINGEPEKAGSIFLDFRNYFDYVKTIKKEYDKDGNPTVLYGQKYENSDNLIIYGHNMHDYSMFGSLKWFINNVNYYDNHPIVLLNSNLAQYKYKIFGMIIVDIDDETDTKFEYWNTLDFEDEQQFYDYVNEVKRRTVRLTDVDVTYGDQLLTLSTCNSTFSEGRLVVFARLLREGEDELEGCTSTPNPNVKWPNSYYKWHKKTYDPDAEFIPYG